MTYKIVVLAITASLCLACSPEKSDPLVGEIAGSIIVGQEASATQPPYGLPLYPGAQVRSSLMDGMSMGVTVTATRDELSEFYSQALVARGYIVSAEGTDDGSVTINGDDRNDPKSGMTVAIHPDANDTSKFTLIFIAHRLP
ncbi:MAG: hypothetical protein Q8S03_15730 [Brevundimonas sp.]|nr:hypothetical protein [Brevundimonas sp.]